jgi:hypothetical protein
MTARWGEGLYYVDSPSYGLAHVRDLLAPEVRDLPDDIVVDYLRDAFGDLSVDEAEDFLGTLKQVGGAIVQALPAVLPIVGAAVGGPIGGVVGGAAGAAVGAATAAAQNPSRPKPAPRRPPKRPAQPPARPAPPSPSTPAPASGPVPAGTPVGQPPSIPGSPSAAQLLSILYRPELLVALLAMTLGPLGRKNVPVADAPVPLGAFVNLLAVLAARAAAEYDGVVDNALDGFPTYLLDAEGNAQCDVSEPSERAEILWEMLHADFDDRASHEIEPYAADYDYLEQLQLYYGAQI